MSPSNLTEAFEDNPLERRRSNPCNHWIIVLVTLLIFCYTYKSSLFMSYSPRQKPPTTEAPRIVQATSTAKTIRTSTDYLATVDDLDKMKKNVGAISMTANSVIYREKNNLRMINTSYSFSFNRKNEKQKMNSRSLETIVKRSRSKLICTYNHTGLGPVKVNKTNLKLEWVDKQYPEVRIGGYYFPPHCNSRHKVAIIVPYRSRQEQLTTFLLNIHPFLIKQQIEYRIFVVGQGGRRHYPFNKGRLYNAAFIEVQKLAQWKCFIFHDVDLLPLDHRILYTCPTWPRHMCATVVGFKRNNPRYRTIFGGVTALTAEQYIKANGYSNTYWSWGGEDNDMFWRLKVNGYGVVRYNKTIAQYTMLSHPQTRKNKYRCISKESLENSAVNQSIVRPMLKPLDQNINTYALLKSAGIRYKEEGLSSVDYKLLHTEDHHLYTHFLVDVNPYRENITQMTIAWINTYVPFGLGTEVFNKRK